LTPAGRLQARKLGDDLRLTGVQVDRIVALPLCRTRDTAILAFGNTVLDRRMYDPAFVAGQLAVAPKPGVVTVLVGSEFQLRQIAGFQLDPAEMAIFRPDGKGGTSLIGRLKLEDWLDD
jgi:broad specificity phosphatase PhoE